MLWDGAFSKESLWIKMKLPGWRFLRSAKNSDRLFAFEDVFAALRLQNAKAIRVKSLCAFLRPPSRSTIQRPDALPETLLNHLLWMMEQFGAIRFFKTKQAFVLTEQGRRLLNTSDSKATESAPSSASAFVVEIPAKRGRKTVNFIAAPRANDLRQFRICGLAPFIGFDASGARIFQLGHERVLQNLEKGSSPGKLISQLKELSGRELPRSVIFLINRWQRERLRVRVVTGAFLETDTPALMDALLAKRGVREAVQRRINPTMALARADRLDHLLRRLRRAKMIAAPASASVSAVSLRKSGKARFSLPAGDAMHLYICARIASEISPVATLPYHAPQALMDMLASLLDAPQRLAADELVKRFLFAAEKGSKNVFLGVDLPAISPARRLKRIVTAMERGRRLSILYDTGGWGEIKHHTIKPARIETRGDLMYLVGLLGEDEVLFRVDRILGFERAAPGRGAQ